MGALAIHQIGDFGWFSERKTASSKYSSVVSALKAHIRYVESKATAIFNSASNILAKAEEELKKRWDSRIALKFWIALPKDWNEDKAFKIVLPFVSEQLGVPLENISAFYHAHPNNPHIHLLIYPRDKNGKKLDIGRKKLREFHKAWDNLLQELGYEIKRYKDGIKLKTLKWEDQSVLKLANIPKGLLYKDAELKELYEEYIKLRKELVEEVKRYDEEETLNKEQNIDDAEIDKAYRKEKVSSIIRFWDKEQKNFKEKQRRHIEMQIKALGLEPKDKVAIVLVGDEKKPLQRILSVEKLLSEKFLAFLRAKNSEGYNIYISVNKLKPTAKKRTKDAFGEFQRTIYLDIDGDKLQVDGLNLLLRIIKEQNLPKPTLLIRTSKYNYQAVWTLSEEKPAQQLEAIMKNLAEKYGLDHTQDISRVFRLAGFYNRKKGKGNLVYIAQGSTLKPTNFEPFKKLLPQLKAVKKKQEEEEQYIDTATQKFSYSKTLDQYREAIKKIFPLAIEHFDNLAEQIVKHQKRFNSLSEFELSLAHQMDKALKDLGARNAEERGRILLKLFTELIKNVRPQKLKRNPKYPQITVAKVIPAINHTPSAGAERPRARVSNNSIKSDLIVSELKRKAEIDGYNWHLFEFFAKEYIAEKLSLQRWKPLSLKALVNLYLSHNNVLHSAYSDIERGAEEKYLAWKKEEQQKEELKKTKQQREKLKKTKQRINSRIKKRPKKGRGFSPGL